MNRRPCANMAGRASKRTFGKHTFDVLSSLRPQCSEASIVNGILDLIAASCLAHQNR
jgi:hypothetical protein